MIHHVARSALSPHTPFLPIFQEAAARAYIRVQSSSSPSNIFDSDFSSRDPLGHPRLDPQDLKLTSLQRLSGNLPARCRLLRHYSSRAQAGPAPLMIPVLNDPPSCYPEKVNKWLPLSQKRQRNGLPRYLLMPTLTTSDTRNEESFANTWETSRSAVTESSTHTAHCSLSRRILHLYMSSPHASIQSLISYHNTFPDQQSSQSYNLLLRLAIRHSAFGAAHALLRLMQASRVAEDQTTWKLCVRLLVREGRWPYAYNLVFNLPKTLSRAPFISDDVRLVAGAELLGTVKRRAFRDQTRIPHPGMCTLPRYRHVMHKLSKLGVSSMVNPPRQVIYASVAALIRMQECEAARQVTAHFVSMDPKGLGLRLVHLHVAPEPRRCSLVSFYRAIRDLRGFRALCPELEPNSTTLFLLLGHLKRVKRCGIIGHKLVRWFRRRWGNSVVSPGVERRLLALAVKEKRKALIKEWMTRVKLRGKNWGLWCLEREVVDGAVPRWRSLTLRPVPRLAKAGTERLRANRAVRRASRVLKN